MISGWKQANVEIMALALSAQAAAEPTVSLADVEKPYAKIGQLVIERDFLFEASSRILSTGRRKR
jgi:transposase